MVVSNGFLTLIKGFFLDTGVFIMLIHLKEALSMGKSKELTDEQYLEQLFNFQRKLLNAENFADYIKMHGIERAKGFYDALDAFQKTIDECAIEKICPNAMGTTTVLPYTGNILLRRMTFLQENTSNVCDWAKKDLDNWEQETDQSSVGDSLKI